MWVVVSNIVIGLYVLDKWSVLCVLYVGGGIYIVIGGTGHVVICVFCMWVVVYSDRTVLTGHVVSVVCSVSWWWDLI